MIIRHILLTILVCACLGQAHGQFSFQINAGVIFSKGTNGSEFPKDYWGRGYSASYEMNSSNMKPGGFLDLEFKLASERLVSPSIITGLRFLNIHYQYSGSIYSGGTFYNMEVDVTTSSQYIPLQLLINIRTLTKRETKLSTILGLGLSIHLVSNLDGKGNYIERFEGGENDYTKYDNDIGWNPVPSYLSFVIGAGVSFKLLNLPIIGKLILEPALTDMYERPNLKSFAINLSLGVRLVSNAE